MSKGGTILHMVLVEWRDDAPADAAARLEPLLARLRSEIPGVLAVSHGANVSPEGLGDGFDWALHVTFADASARDAYLPHPAHEPVAEAIGGWASRVVVYDLKA